MWNSANNTEQIEARRIELLEKGFDLFSSRGIESVTMHDVAEYVGCGIASLYRYFDKKPGYVVAVATWKWEQFLEENRKRREASGFDEFTAVQIFEFYLDSFLEMYRNYKELLRFNQFFNLYVKSADIDADTLKPYRIAIEELKDQFDDLYRRAEQDKTLRTDIPIEEMFSTTLHLMLAAVTRYAVGLVYVPEAGTDTEAELSVLKEMLLDRFRGQPQIQASEKL